MRPTLALLLLAAAPAAAQTPMSPEAFESYATGRTFLYSEGGTAYGAEEYLPGRRVVWTFLDGDCREGRWYADDAAICFVYEDAPEGPQCWQFFRADGGLAARFAGDDGPLVEVTEAAAPLDCAAPYLGATLSE